MESRGRLLGDRYELLVLIATGGMGRVWRARDRLLERPVAVKVLRGEFSSDPTFRARFRAEAQHTAVLTHPNIASVFDYGETEADGECLAYLVMELVEGEALSDVLAREGRLEVQRTLDVVRQTAAALAAAHAAGVVHRDVKPGNVLVGTNGVVKITDFGIASSTSSAPLTRTGQVIGTAHYLSPEQAAGAKASPASDVYALGAVAYECLTGRRAFDGENSVQIAVKQIREEPAPLPATVPTIVRELVEQAMVKDPARRFPDGAAFLAAVEKVIAAAPQGPVGRTGTAVMTLPPVRPTAPFPAGVGRSAAGGGTSAPGAGSSPAGGRRAALRVVLGAVAALVVLAVVVAALRDTPEAPAAEPTPDPTPEQSSPATVEVVPEQLVGRPVTEVQAELVGRGLQVTLSPVTTADVPAGQVTAVDPGGSLPPGSTVTVSYAVAPVVTQAPAPPPEDDEGDGNGNGDRGNGNGRGNGHGNGKDDD